MTYPLKRLQVGGIMLLLASNLLYADAFEDGIAAHDRGDYTTAVKLLRPLAEHGDAAAQTGLGFMYNLGQGVAQDDQQAAEWFRKAAGQGNAMAQSGLGFLYQSGQGVVQNDQEAAKWYQLAAEQGYAIAQTKLGNLYRFGQGVGQDVVKAYMWFSLAAGNDPEAAKMRDELAGQLTSVQLAKAKEMAVTCRTTIYKTCN